MDRHFYQTKIKNIITFLVFCSFSIFFFLFPVKLFALGPTVTSFSPTTAGQGQTVTITGTGFIGATVVAFGSAPAASFNVISDTEITAVVGAGASGSVTVTTAGGSNSVAGFAFITAPVISYTTPQVYTVNTAISPAVPTNMGGAIPANVYAQVTTFAGGSSAGSVNGTGTAAKFGSSYGLATDLSGNIYVADYGNNLIRAITPAAVVTTLAGSGTAGSNNGTGTAASFNVPYGAAPDAAGNVYVADDVNNLIRKITPSGVVTTLAGKNGVAGSVNGTGTAARFKNPFGVAADAAGNVYVADYGNNLIREVTPAGVVTTLAGSGSNGATNGTGAAASFSTPDDLAVDPPGNVFVVDNGNNLIRKITPAGVVTTFAGTVSPGLVNGIGTAASFSNPTALTIDAQGNIYVADQKNSLIRKITPAGLVTTFAGSTSGVVNGIGTAAKFQKPNGITIDQNGNLYLTDLSNYLIRKISTTGYSISAALPAGLTFDATTGIISGTPTAASPATNYTITGYNTVGFSSTIINIKVNPPASSVATLNNLAVSSGILTPTFSPGTTSYTDNVTNSTSSITVTPTVTDATATIKVNGVTVASGSASTAIPLVVGPNTITTKVTAQDGITTDTYTITVNRAPSAVATLSNLAVSSGILTPVFASGTTSYTDNVGNTVTSIKVTPTVTDATATIKVNGVTVASGSASTAIPLVVGPNTITTKVTAQDATTIDTYTITVNRAASAIATLSNLTISSGTLTPTFVSGTISYTDAVANTVNSVTVTPTVTDATATIKVNGTTVTSGSASGAIALSVGPNTITTKVTAQDGTTVDIYTITVTRAASSVATLINLTISSGTLSPVFASGTTNYTVTEANATTSVTMVPTVTDPTAKVTVNGVLVASGAASGNIALNVGSNTITTVVTAQNGITDTYTTTVTRLPSANAGLANLTISSGTLTPAFATGTTGYTDNVANAVTSVTVTPTVADPTATIKVNGSVVSSGAASAPITLNLGPNTITTIVTAQNGITTKTYTIVVNRALSSVATLANLTVSAGVLSPAFTTATTAYTDNVANAITSITVTPTLSDATAKITVNGAPVVSASASAPIALNVGPNTITTIITAQDGITKDTYSIIVTRAASANAGLAGLTISSGTLSPVFATSTTGYTATVTNATTAITVIPVTIDPTATVTVNGVSVHSGSASGAIPLNVGPNTISTVVTAQNGTTKTYTIVVTRSPSAIATLANLTISNGTLTPGFTPGNFLYTDNVANAVTSVTVTPTASDATATITVNGTRVISGNESTAIALNVGANTITTTITAQDGVTTNRYTIIVNRAASSNAGLAGLTISSGTLSPAFATGTKNYMDAVSNATASVTVTPTVSDPNATITVNGNSVTSGTPSAAIALNVGANTITSVVTAPDGITKQTYSITVTRDKGTQTITFNALTDVTYGNPDFDPGAVTSSGLPVIYSSSDPTIATIVNGNIHITGTGTVTITANANANANYYAATPVSESLTVNKADQTISTMDIPVLVTGNQVDLSNFTASSGLPVTFTLSDTTIAVIVGNVLTAKQIGTVTLRVYQPGNDFYNAAETVYTIITINDAKDDELVVHPVVTPNGDGINDIFLVEGIKNYPDNTVTLANRNGVRIYTARGYNNESLRFDGHSNITGDFQPAGTYFYLIDYTDNGKHKHKTGFIVLKY
jgi:gliding motility-associated-like protein